MVYAMPFLSCTCLCKSRKMHLTSFVSPAFSKYCFLFSLTACATALIGGDTLDRNNKNRLGLLFLSSDYVTGVKYTNIYHQCSTLDTSIKPFCSMHTIPKKVNVKYSVVHVTPGLCIATNRTCTWTLIASREREEFS